MLLCREWKHVVSLPEFDRARRTLKALLSPLCLVLALAALIGGFATIAVPPPEVGIDLHRARVEGEEDYQELLEERLERDRGKRIWTIVALFGSAVVLTAAGFLTLSGSSRR